MKYLLWAVLIYLAWRWYTALSAAKSERSKPDGAAGEAAEPMVRCSQCGVHLPQSESVPGAGDLLFCSEDHRALHQQP